jgi:hypothetical protein
MKIRKIYKFLFILFIGLGFAECTGDVEPSCDDCEYFTCLVDGKRFTPHSNDWKKSVLNSATYGGKGISINAYDDDEFIGIGMNLSDSVKVGFYSLATNPPGFALYSKGNFDYKTNSQNNGQLVISKLNYSNKPMMEGSFYFKCVDVSGRQSFSITQGKFRLFFDRFN